VRVSVCLLTGATGSFGQAFLRRVLSEGWTVRAFSRDEHKQAELTGSLSGDVRWLIGDVRDSKRLKRAADGCDVVVHAAALKHVVSCEYNPFEAVLTNVVGSRNVVEAALDCGIPRSVLLSSDKAVHPVNVYGASKLCAEKVWLAAGAYAGGRDVRFSCVRYGNVAGSRGSLFAQGGPVQLTDVRATRFWMEIDAAVDLVLLALDNMRGGDVFVPKLSAARVADELARRNLLRSGQACVGLRPGEKLHEVLVSDEEVRRTWDCGSHYRICDYEPDNACRVPLGFRYSSEEVATAA
jgi:UDP-N-acetylglucosamine 4,6-dehydratase